MSSFQCHCGNWLSPQNASSEGTITCPQCGKVSWPTYTSPPTASSWAAAPPREPNNEAVIGFVLGMVAFFGCILTAPFAIGFSLKGLKKEENKGFAIAGLILGIIQTFVLIGVLLYVCVVLLAIAGVVATAASSVSNNAAQQAAMQNEAQSAITETVLDTAESEFENFRIIQGRWPDRSEGDEIANRYLDGWNRTLVYRSESIGSPSILSRGADGIDPTGDDVERILNESSGGTEPPTPQESNFENLFPKPTAEPTAPSSESTADPAADPSQPPADPASSAVPAATPEPTDKPPTVDQLLEALQSEDRRQMRQAIIALAEMEVDPSRREEVVKAILGLLDEPSLRNGLTQSLETWTSPDQTDLIIAKFTELGDELYAVDLDGLIKLIIANNSATKLLVLFNHPQTNLRTAVRQAIKDDPALQEPIVKQCLSDFENDATRFNAIQWLSDMKVVESQHEAVARAIDPYLRNADDPTTFTWAERVIRAWGPTPDNIDTLAERNLPELLVTIKDRRAFEALSITIQDFPIGYSRTAVELRILGPAGESVVWPLLKGDEFVLVSQALFLLAEIGSEKSIKEIEPLLKEPMYSAQAQSTIDQIKAANRTPAELPYSESKAK